MSGCVYFLFIKVSFRVGLGIFRRIIAASPFFGSGMQSLAALIGFVSPPPTLLRCTHNHRSVQRADLGMLEEPEPEPEQSPSSVPPPEKQILVPDTFSVPASYKPSRLQLPTIGVGTLAWGDPRRGWGQTFNSTDLAEAFSILQDAGVSLYDTSEVYGYQSVRLSESSEQLLSSLVAPSSPPPMISTKFMPVPWTNLLAGAGVRIGRQAVVEAARASVARLGVGSVDVYSLHAPLPYVGGRRALYEGLAEVYNLGLCRAVGLCNVGASQLREAHAALRQLGVPVATNQIKYSVFNIERELDGTIETCLELGVTPIAHTPLAGGLATTYYAHALARRGGRRGRVGRYDARQLLVFSHLFEVMSAVSESVSTESTSRSEAQVALRFVVAKGCVPIPGVNNAAQAKEVAGALDWQLELDDVEALGAQAILLHSRRKELPWLKGL